jgi:GntR family transcriptional regulator
MATGFREIAAELRSAIENGEYPQGSRIPTEQALASQYDVSRETVRRALALLKSDGLLAGAPGRGTYVPPPPVRLTIARYSAVTDLSREMRSLGPWETACSEQGIDGRTELVSVDRVAASADLAERLGVTAGDQLVHRVRNMWAGDQIAQVQEAWMPAALVEGTPLAGPGKVVGGVYAVMTAAGFGPDRVSEEVSGRLPTSDERARMQLTEGGMVLEIWRTTRDQSGHIVEVLRTVGDARKSTLVYDNLPVRRSEG